MEWNKPPGDMPNIDEAAAKLKAKLRGGPGGAKTLGLLAVLFVAFLIGSSAYYTIEPEETGVIQTLGRFDRLTGPGLHFKLPLGIEKVTKVKTGRVLKEEFGFRSTMPGVRTTFAKKGYEDESLMLTGDLNVIDLKWIVQYRIREPQDWLFNIRNGRGTLRDLSESVMRRIVGNRYSDDVLTVDRVAISNLMQQELQKILKEYNSGVQVVTVQLQDVNPPEPVQPAFNEVNEARQEKERMVNEAQQEYNKFIPRAQGRAEQTIAEAEGFTLKRINRAKGEAERFKKMLAEYRQAKDITRKRLYLEAIQDLLAKTEKIYVVDEEQKGILPLLRMEAGK